MQDPNGREGNMISSCEVCQCNCSLGPFKNSDREHLKAAFHEYLAGKDDMPSVSEHRDAGMQEYRDMVNLAVEVKAVDLFILF